MSELLLEAQDLARHYSVSRGLFQPKATVKALNGVSFTLAPAVYLYRERFEATLQVAGQAPQPLSWDLPPGVTKHDPNFGKDLEVYHGDVAGSLGLPSGSGGAGAGGEAILTVGYQGCADAGVCYPPQSQTVVLELPDPATTPSAAPAGQGDGQLAG